MEIKDLLVALSRKDYLFTVHKNTSGYNYSLHKQGDHPIGSRFIIVLNEDETPWRLFWDNPAGTMYYETLQDVYDLYVLGKCSGKWSPSRFDRY